MSKKYYTCNSCTGSFVTLEKKSSEITVTWPPQDCNLLVKKVTGVHQPHAKFNSVVVVAFTELYSVILFLSY
jgi:hypothetical protein